MQQSLVTSRIWNGPVAAIDRVIGSRYVKEMDRIQPYGLWRTKVRLAIVCQFNPGLLKSCIETKYGPAEEEQSLDVVDTQV